MLFAVDCWEYDIKAAGKAFLEQRGFKLSDDKQSYVIQVGNIFKENKQLMNEFYNELKTVLVDQLPDDYKIIRYYVDEVVIDKPFNFHHSYYTFKEKHVKLIILESPQSFVKVYDDSVKISKSFPLQAPDLFRDIADVLIDKTKQVTKLDQIVLIVNRYLQRKYPKINYIISNKGRRIICLSNITIEVTDTTNISLDSINEEIYYNLVFKYIHPLIF